MKLHNIFIALTLLSNLYATEIYTVDDLTIKALENSPDLQISSANYDASKSRYEQAKANFLPKIDLHVSAGEVGKSDIPTNPNNMINDSLILGKLSINQILYDFGKTGESSNSFKYDSQSYSNEYKQKISDKKRDVKSAYYDILKAIALINVNKENIKLNKAQLYRSQKYFEAGIRTKIDVSDASVELIKSTLDLKKSQYNLKLAYAKLDKVIGFKDINNDYKVYSKDLDLKNLYQSLTIYNLSLDKSVNFSYENRYEIKKQMALIKVAKANSYLASSDYYPSIYLNADYTKQNADKLTSSVPKNQWQASINLDWNIYQGGATDAATQEKKIKVDIANSNLAYSKLLIKTKTTQAYINVHKAKDSVELSQSILQVSSEKFKQASKRYKNGLSDFIELQQARQGYIDAMASLVVDYYDYYKSIAILDNAIGR